ncbi:MAG: glycosyltransferase family 39 protein [Thermodesulfovibrionia bacterium]|nr:glycosyltransferase family 39 protein [Thermodesulfovibrionia bacterium]
MIRKDRNNGRFFLLILLYGLVAMAWNLDYNSAYHDEALNILMGRQVLSGQSCYGCAQNTGSVLIQPVLAAIGDSIGGLQGARAVGILFGLSLTAVVYLTASILLSEKYAFVAAVLFLFSGNTIYLSKLATYDIVSAFFLGLSFLFLILSERKQPLYTIGITLFCGAFSLFLAAMTKYVAAVFIPPLLVYIFLRHKIYRAVFFFLLPLLIFIFVYSYYALYPVKAVLMGSVTSVYHESQLPFSVLSSWTFRWVIMSYLLAFFGIFHEEKGKTAIPLIILSTPIIILQFLTGAEQSINKNVIFSLIFLMPAAALGIDHMSALFSYRINTSWVKPFFTISVLLVTLVFGIDQLRWLERQYPNMSEVVDFFKRTGFDGMVVSIDSDYGDAVYTYALKEIYPRAKFLPITEIQPEGKNVCESLVPDYVIIDGYYGKSAFRDMARGYIKNGYSLEKKVKISLSWGVRDVQIFSRR